METETHVGPPRGVLLVLGLVAIVVGGALAGEFIFGLQPGIPTVAAASGTVTMPLGVGSDTSLTYSPATVVVIIGQNNTVNFVNKDTAPHTVTADDGSFDSGNIAVGANWTYTFTTPGTFHYHCSYHNWMHGTVIVEANSTGTSAVSSGTNSTSTNSSATTTGTGTSVTTTAAGSYSGTSTAAAGAGTLPVSTSSPGSEAKVGPSSASGAVAGAKGAAWAAVDSRIDGDTLGYRGA